MIVYFNRISFSSIDDECNTTEFLIQRSIKMYANIGTKTDFKDLVISNSNKFKTVT